MLDTQEKLKNIKFRQIYRQELKTLQVNLGYKCNQQCLHCHVNASPKRSEIMSLETINNIKKFIVKHKIKSLDLTGGAPELNPNFYDLVTWATKNNIELIDRCNLTILLEPNQKDLVGFLAENKVTIVASMPCYLEENVDAQRGKGTYGKSIKALKLLNQAGYGKIETGLILNLVYNPQDANLPPAQTQLEQDYKKQLMDKYQIEFNNLLVITNVPIARFGSSLISKGLFDQYLHKLQTSFNPSNLDGLMCKSLISVDWQGYLFDCDFNQMLNIPLSGKRVNIKDFNHKTTKDLAIEVGGHCFACTAGQGSSCSGALA